jgi:ParB family chromosome partitioning protein
MPSKIMNRKTQKNREVSMASMVDHSSELKTVNTDLIDFSPLNYRKFFPEESLNNFAQELAIHGIISPLMLRPTDSGRYELIAGERRFRAALIAQLQQVPAVIRAMSDEEVIEIQLAENIQRENPHPMHEAFAIGQMQRTHRTIEEMAARLGKSKPFVYARLKLLSLIESFQEMFLADVLTTQQAVELASFAPDAQQQFFGEHCQGWQKKKDFQLHDLGYLLRPYKYDLCNAPFNTKDKKLIESVGACTQCPSNTATLKSLFPELAKQAVCSNSTCYQKKCTMHLFNQFEAMFVAESPAAFLFQGEPTSVMETIISLLPEAATLPKYDRFAVSVLFPPDEPNREDFEGYNDEEEPFDEAGYQEAMQEYAEDLGECQQQIAGNGFQKALLCSAREITVVWFSTEKAAGNRIVNGHLETVTAKAVQKALKEGTATPGLLESEIERIRSKEVRSQEIDKEKIQLQVHEQFTEMMQVGYGDMQLTEADRIATRLMVYQSLDYHGRHQIDENLLVEQSNRSESLYEQLAELTDAQFAYLIRVALLNKSDSKYPVHDTAQCLVKVAEAAGLNVTAIEQEQEQKAMTRQQRQQIRIADLKKKMAALEPQA